jgi:SAM-dependent methyltransferase
MTSIVNRDQAAAWDGDEGEHWSAEADRYDLAGSRLDAHLLNAATLAPESVVLDIGCGTGASTRGAARIASAGRADGIDLSRRQLEEGTRRSAAAGLTNVRFIHGDAQVYPFREAEYDVAMSRFGVMFFADPVAALRNVGAALKPAGRLALLVWQPPDKNAWVSELRAALDSGRDLPEPPIGVPGPFGMADPDRTRRWLTDAGYEAIRVSEVVEPMWLGGDPDDALDFVAGFGVTRALLADLDVAAREASLAELRRRFAAHATPDGVLLGAAAFLITGRRPA